MNLPTSDRFLRTKRWYNLENQFLFRDSGIKLYKFAITCDSAHNNFINDVRTDSCGSLLIFVLWRIITESLLITIANLFHFQLKQQVKPLPEL
jgi:hypothetical protein